MAFVIAAMFCIAPFQCQAADITNTENVIDARVSVITAEDLPNYTKEIKSAAKAGGATLNAGDYRVAVCISNNTGFGATGLRVYFDYDNFEPVTYTKGEDVCAFAIKNKQLFGDIGFTFSYSEEEHMVTWGTMSTENNTENGEIASFFFRLKDGADPSAVSSIVKQIEVIMWNTGGELGTPVNPTVANDGFWLWQPKTYADTDGDGKVSQIDAQITLEIATILMTEGKELTNYNFGDRFIINSVFSQTVAYLTGTADINHSGSIDVLDAQSILMYSVEALVSGDSARTTFTFDWHIRAA
jgi:hypothetical protein